MSEDTLKPGQARAKGASIADVISTDEITGPAPLLESKYDYLGDEDISAERYTSPEFFDREMNQLWPKAWQWACREEHLQEVGDNYVYDVGDYSVIIVRGDEETIKAYLNVCTHRGTRLLGVEGSGYNQGFTCPFHGWSWNLNGSINNIPGRWDFPHVCEEKHGLQKVLCERWGDSCLSIWTSMRNH